MAKAEKRFPLDILLIMGHMHMGSNTTHNLQKYLSRHPAVRSYGVNDYASNQDRPMEHIRAGRVNTIFINPCFPSEEVWDSEPFISEVRKDNPNIVFVLYTHRDCLERFCKVHPRFNHYFYLEEIWDYPNEYCREALDLMLELCEEWHRTRYQYDVGISFASEDRKYAEEIADGLTKQGARVFYDAYEEADLLGKNLYTHLHTIYSEKCRYCLILISKAYANKVWTSHERVAAQERALQERDKEYIIPVRLDDTVLPGLSSVVGYVKIDKGTAEIARLISQKLWNIGRKDKAYIESKLY